MEIIVTHVSSDFDSFAGMVAAKKIYNKAKIVIPNSINQNVRRFIVLYEDSLPTFIEQNEIDTKKIRKIIIIDTRIPSRIGSVKEVLDDDKNEIIIYDHHQKTDEDIKRGKDFTEIVGASTTILVNIIRKKNIYISPFDATLFSLGIYEDTGSFTFPNTTYKDLDAASFLKRKGADSLIISRFLNTPLTEEQHGLLEDLIASMRKININGKEIIISSAKNDFFVEGVSVLARKLGQVEDVDIVFCWVKMKDKIYVIARSEDMSVDVSKVLGVIGGGGHSQAASAVLKNMSFNVIEKKIILALKDTVEKPLLAKDIMSFPVRFINEDNNIRSADQILKKYGHSGIPIVNKREELVGIITRKDIDKAIKHGLSHAPVKGFKSHGVIKASPDTTIIRIQKMMIENAIGRVPITRGKRIIGIVTRKDVLRYLHGRDHLKYPDKSRTRYDLDFTGSEIKERLCYLFSSRITDIFNLISSISERLGMKAYLVGGIVRDILIGKPNLDIDIVIEGDGIKFARKLAPMISARLVCHDKFRTAVLVIEDDQHIDIASSRVEYYDSPAALPDVEPGSIRQDLARRDFTINTLALSLNRESFGEILDYFGGRKDIAERKVKILHKLSFIEDPTRIFRAVRFEQRLGFKMDELTEKLARNTIKMNLVSRLAGIRIRDELIAILKEDSAYRAIRRLYEMDAFKGIGLDFNLNKKTNGLIRSAMEKSNLLSSYLSGEFKQWRMLIIILVLNKRIDNIKKWCSAMKIKKKDTKIIVESACCYNKLKSRLARKIIKKSTLYRIFRNLPDEIRVILSTESNTHLDNIRNYYEKIKPIKLDITGSDLKSLSFKPSKNYRIALERLMEMKIDGRLGTKKQQMEEAKKILSRLKSN